MLLTENDSALMGEKGGKNEATKIKLILIKWLQEQESISLQITHFTA